MMLWLQLSLARKNRKLPNLSEEEKLYSNKLATRSFRAFALNRNGLFPSNSEEANVTVSECDNVPASYRSGGLC